MITQLGIEKEIEFIPLEQGYHLHLDFNHYLYSGGEEARQRLIEQLIRIFPHEAQGIKAFFDKLVKIYRQADYASLFLGIGRDPAYPCESVYKRRGGNYG